MGRNRWKKKKKEEKRDEKRSLQKVELAKQAEFGGNCSIELQV